MKNTVLVMMLGCLIAFASGCQPRTVVRNGVQMSYEQAAGLDFRLAEERYAQGKKAESVAILQELIKRYPSSSWTDDAYSKLGDISLADAKYAEAAGYYKTLIDHYSFSSLKNRATFRLGVAQYQLTQYAQAAATLTPLLSRLTDPVDRLETATLIAQSYESLKTPEEAVPYYANMALIYKSHPMGSDLRTAFVKIPSQDVVRKRSIDIINQTQDERFLRKLAADFGDSFPAQYALMRLAQLEIAAQNQSSAEAHLEELVKRFPTDPLADEGRTMLRRSQSRLIVNENKIGVLLPLSGPHAKYGQEALRGIEIAVALMADSYPNSKLQFVVRDSSADAKIAADRVASLVSDDQVVAIIGPLFGAPSVAAAKQAQALGVPMINLSSSEGIPSIGNFIFRNALLYRNEVKALVNYALAHSAGTPQAGHFAMLYPTYPNSNYGLMYRDLFWDEANARGATIVGCEPYKHRQTDFRNEVQKMTGLYYPEPRASEWNDLRRQAKEKGKRLRDLTLPPMTDFSALFLPVDSYTTATLIADHLPYFDVKGVQLLGNSNWNNPQLLERSRRNVQGAVFTDGFFAESQRTTVAAFVANFRAAFASTPTLFAANAYDSAEILISLLQNPRYQTRDNLRQGLSALRNYDGVTGVTSFGEDREVQKDPILLKVEGDKFVEVQRSAAP